MWVYVVSEKVYLQAGGDLERSRVPCIVVSLSSEFYVENENGSFRI